MVHGACLNVLGCGVVLRRQLPPDITQSCGAHQTLVQLVAEDSNNGELLYIYSQRFESLG